MDPITGEASFHISNITGFQNAPCNVNFLVTSPSIPTIEFSSTCSFILYGCKQGYGIHYGTDEDTCKICKYTQFLLDITVI